MSLSLTIADIPLYLKGAFFPKGLYPVEKIMLQPFITKIPSHKKTKERYILANIETINYKGYQRKPNINPELVKKIRRYFCDTNNGIFEDFFRDFIDKALKYYLAKDPNNEKMLYNLLHDNHDYNKIIIQRNSFVLSDKRNCSYSVIHKNFNLSEPYLHNAWPYNLQIIRSLFRMVLNSKKDGIMVHASCAEDNGEGYVFIGPGNSGKSTVIKTLPFCRILSDDTAIIRKINNTYYAYPNPWWNFKSAIDIRDLLMPARLKALFFIYKSGKTSIRKLDYKESLGKLVYGDAAFQQNGFFDNKSGVKNFYLFSQALIRYIPCFELKIKKGTGFKKEFKALISRYLKER